ncbi:glutamate--tRNA ligase [Patescibacteria group bacterium]|nr:glutamate--tRNA ligase [Patescibacteria group bacterium]
MVRTRFAPSPTGFLHIGGLKTALFAYLFARKNNGSFILRIEDTDQNRYVKGGMEQIIWSLKWVGISYDEGPDVGGQYGPYIQTQRKDIYQKFAIELINRGFAYYCFCSSERLNELRKYQNEHHLPSKYDRHCLNLSKEEIKKRIENGEKYVIRMKIPDNEIIKFHDLIKGDVEFNSNELDDQILIKSDGLPTYHFAVVIDDHLMNITHVIRADEWLSSTPKHILLYRYFGWDIPQYVHVPPILGQDGKKKLSKREGSVSVNQFAEAGYLREGLINYLALLGWNPGTTEEIFTIDDLINKFDLNKCQKAGAIFDPKRLDWINGQHIRKMTLEDFSNRVIEYVENYKKDDKRFAKVLDSNDLVSRFMIIEKQRINKLSEIEDDLYMLDFDYKYDINGIFNAKMGVDKDNIKDILEKSIDFIQNKLIINYSVREDEESKMKEEESIKQQFISFITDLKLKNGQVLWPIRFALSGKDKSAGVFELVWAIGKDETIKRINASIAKL